jgi:hypothetical protein
MNLMLPIAAFGFFSAVIIIFGGLGYAVGMVGHWIGIY